MQPVATETEQQRDHQGNTYNAGHTGWQGRPQRNGHQSHLQARQVTTQ
jgi:hypothetical protein